MRVQSIFIGVTVIIGVAVTRVQAGDWSVSAGYAARCGMDVNIKGSSYVQSQGIHSGSPAARMPLVDGPAYRYDPGPGNLGQYADRSFDDGFVNLDPGTDDPNAIIPGLTWNWGYDNASQYDANANALSFHKDSMGVDVQTLTAVNYDEQLTRSTLRDSTLSLDDDMSGSGIGLSADRGLFSKGMFSIRIGVGVNAIWGAHSQIQASPFAENVQKDRIRVEDDMTVTDTHRYHDTYTYDTTGVTPPAVPYAGTYDGPGPVIPNIPSSFTREVTGNNRQTQDQRQMSVVQSASWIAANNVTFDTQSSLYNFWIGPRFDVNLAKRLSLFAAPSISVNYVDAEVKRSEIFSATYANGSSQVLQSWQDSGHKGGWLLGTGLSVGADIAVVWGWSVEVNGGYDWVFDDLSLDVGPNRVSVNAGGYSLGTSLRKTF